MKAIVEAIGDSNINMGKALIKLCPEYIPTYLYVREDMLKAKKTLSEPEKEIELIQRFNNPEICNETVEEYLVESMNSDSFKQFEKAIFSLKD